MPQMRQAVGIINRRGDVKRLSHFN
jgi:hypothetical protein